MTRQLIVNADDFGRTRGVSRGILRAHLEGIVTSPTAMLNMPGVADDLRTAEAEAPSLGLGVHLNFTAGRPLMPPDWVASLIDERGLFLSQAVIYADPFRLDREELRSELKAQVTAFKNVTGRLPDHVDVHHFVHMHPYLFEVYLEVADEFDLPARVPIPRNASNEPEQLPHVAGGLPPAAVQELLRQDRRLLEQHPVKAPAQCILSFYDKGASSAALLEILTALPEGISELMTHPGLPDAQLNAESSYNRAREREIAVLTDAQVIACVKELSLELVTFAAVA